NRLGLSLSGVDFALAILSDTVQTWVALKAGVDSASLTGIEGLALALSSLQIEINRKSANLSIVDFSAAPLTLGGLTLDLDAALGQLTRASGTISQFTLYDFIHLSGSLGFEQSGGTLDVIPDAWTDQTADRQTVNVTRLLVSGTNLTGFAGSGYGSANPIGLSVSDVDMVMAFLTAASDDANHPLQKWFSLIGSLGSVSFSGVAGLVMQITNAVLEINKAAADGSIADFSDTALAIGSQSIDLDGAWGDYVKIAGSAEINLFDLLTVTGSFGFQKKTGQDLYVSGSGAENVLVEADLLTVALADVSAFAGFDGIGLTLSGVNLVVALWTEVVTTGSARVWASVMGSVSSASFAGISGLSMVLSSLAVLINKPAADGTLADYFKGTGETEATSLSVPVSAADSVDFTLDDAYGDYGRITGSVEINLFDFIRVEGSFGVEKKTSQTIYISGSDAENTAVQAELLTFGLADMSGFAGLNGIGLDLSGVDLAIALWNEIVTTGTARTWTSVMGSLASASLSGITGLVMTLTSGGILINKAAPDGTVVDYVLGEGESNATDLSVAVGPDTTVDFTLDDEFGDYTRLTGSADLNMFDVVTLNGSFGMEKKTGQTAFISGTTEANVSITADLLTIGLANVSAFAGFNGVGLNLTGVDLAVAIWKET
ncbi:MAG: hypothetical protein AAGU05_06370, partial [Anaerolineaceae bacterium]